MFRIVHLPDNIDDLTLALIRHKTWITLDDHQYESKLLNQYDLAEVIEGAHEALTPEQRRRAYRQWLWEQMQHEHGVVWRELCDLADAHEDGKEIVITVHVDSVHAEIITSAIEWLAANTEPVSLPERKFRNNAVPFDYTGLEMPEERWPVYDPADATTSPTTFDVNRVCWIVGHEQALLGYLYDTDAVRTALVVGYGLVKLGRTSTRLHPFKGRLESDWIAAISAMLQDLTPDSVPLRLDVRTGATTREDIRYASWRPDLLVPDETNLTPFNASQIIGRSLPEVKWRSQKRPYFLRRVSGDNVRPVLRWHHSKQRPPRVLGVEQQTHGQFYAWRKATPADWHELHTA